MLLGSGNLRRAVIGWEKQRHTDIYTEKLGSGRLFMPLWSCSNYTGTWSFSINSVQHRGVWCGMLTSVHRWAVSGYKHLGGGICGSSLCIHCSCLHLDQRKALPFFWAWLGVYGPVCVSASFPCVWSIWIWLFPYQQYTHSGLHLLFIHWRLLLLPRFPSYVFFQKSHPQ